ncbi:sec23/sec24 transport family protein [Quillaja saponaria]|uniref:Sec23/sec24 transport family protein n=1 Tax=Quillaja saponaria TaxID=32244 RepID=A0AAD7VMJ9_QUISA|nr:sec23/sec24 transport family protein [Quillaja saponaria]
MVPPEELTNSAMVSASRTKHSLKRQLRVRTLQFGTTQNINELYDSVDPEVLLSLLVHKAILSSLEQGVWEGRMLLHDWLVILTAQYNEAYELVEYHSGSSLRSHIDVAFSQCPQLQPLPRLVFALLRKSSSPAFTKKVFTLTIASTYNAFSVHWNQASFTVQCILC